MKGRVNRRKIRVLIRTDLSRMGLHHAMYAIDWKHQLIGGAVDKKIIDLSKIDFG